MSSSGENLPEATDETDADPGLLGLEYLHTFDSFPTKDASFTLVREGMIKAAFTSECRGKDVSDVESVIDEWIVEQTFETVNETYGFIAQKLGPPEPPEDTETYMVDFVYYLQPTAFE